MTNNSAEPNCLKHISYYWHISWLLIIIGLLISFGISSSIIEKGISKNERVYYLSKIATIKNIVKINHNSKIFDHFNSDGNLEGITTKYNKLLNLTTNDGCKEGYKKCGILDTLGNVLCIDNNFGCPINKLTVDLLANKRKYINQGLKEIYNENLIYNYKFYYSNESLDGNRIVSLLFADERPRYITSSNFIVDLAAYKDYYNDKFDNLIQGKDDKDSEGKNFGENLISIFAPDEYVEKLIKTSLSLLSFMEDSDNDKEKFKNYVENKLKTEENKIDKYYLNVGENAYIKNYIGFKSLKDVNRFMNFDYNIYKDNYPTKTTYIIALVILIFDICYLAIIFILYCDIFEEDYQKYKNKKDNNNNNNVRNGNNNSQYNNTIDGMNVKKDDLKKDNESSKLYDANNENKKIEKKIFERKITFKCLKAYSFFIFLILMSFAFIALNLYLLIHSANILYKNHNNKKKLNILNNIESDDFIQRFLYEFKKKCRISSLLILTIVLLGATILIYIPGIIIVLYLLKKIR